MLVLKFWNITQFPFGGTSILITVGVMLETMKQIDSQLMMRNYEGFLQLSGMTRRSRASCCSASRVPARAPRPARLGGALRRRAPLDRRHVPRAGGAGHRVRPRGQALHGRGRARPRRDRRRRDRGVPRARRSARRRLRARRLPAHAAPGRRSSTGSSAAARSTSSINLDVPREIVLDRLAGRRVCENCQRVYHVNLPPTSTGPATRAAARSCSATTTPKRRSTAGSSSTSSETVPIIEYYRERGMLAEVDGVGEGDDVFERLVEGRRRPPAARDGRRSGPAQDAAADRAHAAARARSSPRCTRRARARPSRARPPPTSTPPRARCSTAAAPARTSSATTASRRWRASRRTR